MQVPSRGICPVARLLPFPPFFGLEQDLKVVSKLGEIAAEQVRHPFYSLTTPPGVATCVVVSLFKPQSFADGPEVQK